ncbi:Ger(x)C family spore germination protein [Alkalihalophilus pseudofirmus]|uniref:Ger(x)C family spore germination protein n=1 Tax=Alkalihalophilus pseudofirmus TaxID=79885 RepID=UPI00259BAD39|nr:Ger(x)C family spore germination protein [Alkalihalophilus pseudofirmus]WEG18806.1 Ger(x)C family spore germination protein [Alkalihalophilus pseudofirmus]
MCKEFGKWIFILLIIAILLSGCRSDMKEIQNLNYATAIGVDYKDDKYFIYIQLIGLTSVARTEGEAGSPQTFVSTAEGETFIDAFFEVYQTGQEMFIWSHITSIVLSESVLNEGIGNVFDGLTRYYEFRLTPWVFGTKEPIDKVLSTQGFFDQSVLETTLHNPESTHRQSSIIRPIKLQELARDIYEPAMTTYIPYLSISEEEWINNMEPESKLKLEGAFFLSGDTYKGSYSLEELNGLRWIAPETKRAAILVPGKKRPDFLAVIDQLNVDIALKDPSQKSFTATFNLDGQIGNQINGNNKLFNMKKDTSESIQKEIRDLYLLGVQDQVDFFNLEHLLYRNHNTLWKQSREKLVLDETALEDIEVKVNLYHTGAFKNKIVEEAD